MNRFLVDMEVAIVSVGRCMQILSGKYNFRLQKSSGRGKNYLMEKNTDFKGTDQIRCLSFGEINYYRNRRIHTTVAQDLISLIIYSLFLSYFNSWNDALSHMPEGINIKLKTVNKKHKTMKAVTNSTKSCLKHLKEINILKQDIWERKCNIVQDGDG